MRRIIDLDAPDRFVAGRAGGNDEEAFFLQAVRGSRVVSVALERQQVALLADRMLVIVGELERRGLLAIEAATTIRRDGKPADEPLRVEFHVSVLTIGWDNDASRVVVEAQSMVFDGGAGESAPRPADEEGEDELPDDDPLGPDVLRVRLTPFMAQQFARQAGRLAS